MKIIDTYCLLFIKTSGQKYHLKFLEDGSVVDVFTGKETIIKSWRFKNDVLYLSQQIILAHGGEITVKSEENVRTEFCVKLPL